MILPIPKINSENLLQWRPPNRKSRVYKTQNRSCLKKETKNKIYWILKKPLSYYEQKVEVAPSTALGFASVLNEICVRVGNVDEICDPFNISDRDLSNLVSFVDNFLNNKANQEESP